MRKQNKIELTLIVPRKWIARKILAAGSIQCVLRGREKSHGTSKKWLKPPLAGAPHTHEVACLFCILG